MTAPQVPTAPVRSSVAATTGPARPRRPAAPAVPASGVTDQPALHEVLCRWVPGTTDRVRLTINLGQGKQQSSEVKVARLAQLFGKAVVHDLYLKGCARLKADPQQLDWVPVA